MKKRPRTRRRLAFSDAADDDVDGDGFLQFPALRRLSSHVYTRGKPLLRPISGFLVVVVSVATVQWACIQFLARYCSTWSWSGPVKNIFALGSPACMYVNVVQMTLAENYVTLWAGALGATLAFVSTHLTVDVKRERRASSTSSG
jgi:hypothetical protein